MPGRKHLPGVTAKQQRQYEHIKRAELAAGRSLKRAKQIAAATVNKAKARRRRRSRETLPSFAQQLAREVEQSLTASERKRLRKMGFYA